MIRPSIRLALLALALLPLAARALSTAFLYQGRLAQAGAAPTGSFDFTFALYDAATDGAQVGDTVTLAGVAVANGLFAAPLDFGGAPFQGADRWLEIGVRAAGGPSYAVLAPRQPLAPTPYALFARAVNWDDILNRPAAFGVYTAGPGLTLAGQEFAIAGGGVATAMLADGAVTPAKLASDATGLAKVSGGIAVADQNGVSIGSGAPLGRAFAVYANGSTPMGVEMTTISAPYRVSSDIWQSFTAPADTTLASIELLMATSALTTATLTVYSGEGTGGAVLGTQAVTLTAGYGFKHLVLAPPVDLAAGTLYTFALSNLSGNPIIYYSSGYPGGRMMAGAGWDLYFRLFSDEGPVGRAALLVDRHSLNVGIGTTIPGFPLTFANMWGDKISLYGQSGDHFGFGIQSNLLQIFSGGSGADIAFGYGQSGAMTETVRFTGAGNVGIGTATPAAKLDVNGTARMTGFQLGTAATAGQVLTADAAGVGSWAALPAAPTTLPPSGAAGGDLSGTYPNPTVGAGKIDSGKILDGAVAAADLAANAVTTAKILDANVTTAKLADGAVTSVKIADATIAAADLAANAVTTAKILDANVTTAKLADSAVTSVKIADGTVAMADLADGAVTDAKVSDVAWGKITGAPSAFPPTGAAGGDLTGTYPNPTIAADAVQHGKLAGDAESLAKVSGGIMRANPFGVGVGKDVPTGRIFQVFAAGSTPMGVQQTSHSGFISGVHSLWQSFTAPADTTLAGIEIMLASEDTQSGTLTIYSGEGTGGAVLGTQAATLQAGMGYHTLVLAAPITLTAGQAYTFGLFMPGDLYIPVDNDYTGGRAWYTGFACDVVFRLFSAVGTTGSALLVCDQHARTVGIGTETPGFPLTFANALGDKISLWGQSGDHYGFGIQGSLLQVHTANSSSDIAFGYGQSGALTETVRFKGTGNVGIGTSTPAAKLDVNGTARMTGFQLGTTATAGQVLTADAAGVGAWAALPDAPTTLPPSGAAGGDLAGAYPNPTVGTGKIDSAKILDGTIAAADLAANAVTTAKILDANVTTAKLADGAVTSAKIADATIATADLADGAVTTAKILDATVAAADLAANAVTTAKILDANVTTAKLADGAVTSAKIADATIATADLADGAVTTAKILDATVAAADLAANAVTTAKILDANVTTAKLADGAVTAAKLASDAAGLDKVSGGVMASLAGGIVVGENPIPGPVFQVTAAPHTQILSVLGTQGGYYYHGGGDIWQSFTAPSDTTLAAIELQATAEGTGTATLTVYSGEGTAGTVLSTQTVTLAAGAGFFTFVLPTPVALANNQKYTFGLSNFAPWMYVPFADEAYYGGASWSGGVSDLVFRLFSAVGAAATPALTVDPATGYVGIDTAMPGYPLHVNGRVAGVGTYLNLSDARFKTNIRPLTAALTRIGRLQGVEFDWKRDGTHGFRFDDQHQLGFLAQEVEKVVPEAVTKGADGVYSMSYTTLIPLLVEGMKELRAENAALQAKAAEVDAVKAQLAAQQQRLEQLEALVAAMAENK